MLQVVRNSVSGRLVFTSAVLAGLIFALLLAAFPALHDQLHAEADGAQHECLATVLHFGFGAGPETPPTLVIELGQWVGMGPTIPQSRRVESLFLSACVFEHAPPV